MDILTFLGNDYRYASLITLYFVVLGISIQKWDQSHNFITLKFVVKKFKSIMFKMDLRTWLSGNYYRVALLSNSYLTPIIMQSLKSIGQF